MYWVSVLIFRGVGIESLRLMLVGAVLMKLSREDIKGHRLPDRIIMIGCAVSLLRIFEGDTVAELALGVIPAISVLAVVLILDMIRNRSTLGGGDIKMMFMIGLNFGMYRTFVIILIAGILFVAVDLLHDRQHNLPFGPMLALASWMAIIK